MSKSQTEILICDLFALAGITVHGDKPWDIQVHNPQFYQRVMNESSLGLGETYVDGWWDCQALDQFFYHLLKAHLDGEIKTNSRYLLRWLFSKIINFQTKTRSLMVGKQHYDLGNELFQCMLDPLMNYTCGYWKDVNDLAIAQKNKLELTCQKLLLKPGMKVLDIGCGYGAFAKYAAKNYGVQVEGVTISKEQAAYAKENCSGLPVKIEFLDYRDIQGQFDRIVSLGMFEHVGHLNYRTYMKVVNQHLNENGLFLLHSIGDSITSTYTDPWINRYIFPNSHIPSIKQIGKAAEGLFVMEDWHNFGAYYDKTLMAWHANFNQHWDQLKESYDDRFHRLWNYYLLSCAGSFRARNIQLWQIVFSKNGVEGGYIAPR